MGTVTARIPEDIASSLDALAESTKRSKSFLVAEAIRTYLETHAWQVSRTMDSLAQADNGQFASPEQVKDAFGKLGLKLD